MASSANKQRSNEEGRPFLKNAKPSSLANPGGQRIEARSESKCLQRPVVFCGLLLAVAGLTAAVHWPALSAQATCFDDQELFLENHLVHNPSWNSVGRFFGEVAHPSTVGGYYFPLTMTSLMLDWMAGGRPDDLRQFHRTNLALHVASTLLVLLILYALFGDPWVAAAVSLIFGLHPLTVSPITWVSERRTVLAAVWGLLGLLAYIRYARRGGWKVFAAALSAYVLALLSKPTSVPLCVVLVFMDFWPLCRLSRRTILEKWPFFAAAALAAVATWTAQSETAAVGTSSAVLLRAPVQAGYLLAFYAGKMLWPANLSMAYPTPEPMSLTNSAVLAHLAITLGLAALLAVSLRWTRALLTGAAIFLIVLLPTLGIVQFAWSPAMDKYLYLPAIGLLMAGAYVLTRCRRGLNGRPAAPAVNVALALALLGLATAEALGTRAYLQAWQTAESLGRRMVQVAPRSPHAYSILAAARADAGHRQEAIELLRTAVAVGPDSADAHYNLAVVLAEDDQLDEAIFQYVITVRLAPKRASAHNNLANLLARKGDLWGAREHYRRFLELRPDSPEAGYNLAKVELAAGEPEEARRHCLQSLQYAPNRAETYDTLGQALARLGDRVGALAAYRRSVDLAPENPVSQCNLANGLAAQGNDREAVAHYTRAIELRPEYPLAHNNLGNSLVKLGQPEAALARYREAIRLRPEYALARMNLADALLQDGQTEPALEQYREAVRLEPRNASTHVRLGRALERIGQPGPAAEEYRQVLQINPQHAEARRRLEALAK